jgi:predicted Ser/Thr protein kinase
VKPSPGPESTVADNDATTIAEPKKSAMPAWRPPAPGTKVDRYEVRATLGAGGMGTVVSAWDPQLSRPVALKFVGQRFRDDDQERLIREARAMAQLRHANVVPVYDVGTWEGRVFLAMELIDGVNFKEWADAHRRAPHEVVNLLCQVGAALSAAHAAGIVHRDVKPANVLVDRDGRALITDFGIARVGDTSEPTPRTLEGPIGDATADGVIVGTVGYLAPEAMYGELATPAVDQFALAVVACQLFTGVLPFPTQVDPLIAQRLRRGELVPQELNRVPRRLRKVLLRALAGDPKRRYPSMEAFCKALAPPPPATRTRWIVRIAAAIVLIPAYLTLLGYGLTRLAVDTVIGGCRGRAMRATMEVWPPERLAEVTARWGQRPAAVAEAYAARWRDASLGACLNKDLSQLPTRLAQAQRDCLDDTLQSLGKKVGELETAGATAFEADAQLRELSDPRVCVDTWRGETPGRTPWPPPQ